MKSYVVNFLTGFIGAFVGVFVVKHFIFPGDEHSIPDWMYGLIIAFIYGGYSAIKGDKPQKTGIENEEQ